MNQAKKTPAWSGCVAVACALLLMLMAVKSLRAQQMPDTDTMNKIRALMANQGTTADATRPAATPNVELPAEADPARVDDGGTPTKKPRLVPRRETSDAEAPASDRRTTTEQPASEDATLTERSTRQERLGTRRVKHPYGRIPALEDLYRQIKDDNGKIERFGMELFRNSAPDTDSAQMDLPAGPDYVLGPGDSVVLNLYGGYSQTLARTVDREGRIQLPEVGAVTVAGKPLGEAQQTINRELASQFKNTKAEISLTRVRSVRVYVVGDVERPGAYNVTSLSTPLGALLAAGGPTSRGSLRALRHMRGNRLVAEVDLYDFLLKGVRSDVERLLPGDTIVVPPVGAQVTVKGSVRRPAIYEVRGKENLGAVLELAGGVLVTGALGRIDVERVDAHEQRTMVSLQLHGDGNQESARKLADFGILDGDVVTIASILPYSNKAVYLDGHVMRPGKYSYREGMKITDLVHSYQELLPEPAERAEIIRLVAPDFHPTTIEFNLGNVLAKDGDLLLQPFDTVRIYSRYETDAPRVQVLGEVLHPGEYPLASGMRASELVLEAGGLKRSARGDVAELTSYVTLESGAIGVRNQTFKLADALAGDVKADPVLKPGDIVSVRRIEGWNNIGSSVEVSGEVVHAGSYGIGSHERLSSVLKRAGGFTGDAYPTAAVLRRMEVRKLEDASRKELLDRLDTMEVTAPSKPEDVDKLAAANAQRQAIKQRLNSLQSNGRLVVRIGGDMRAWENTPADIELRPGDTLFIPKKPGFVLVSGQVNNPTAITFTPGKSAGWYLQHAGGHTEMGDEKRAFVLRADGSVVSNGGSHWFTGDVMSTVLKPGDAIVVPERILAKNSSWKTVLESAQLASTLAIAARVALSF